MNSFAWDKFRKQQATEREQLQRLLSGIHGLLARCLTTAPTEIELSALAASLHSFYTGVENIFKRMAMELDGKPVRGDSWHRELLLRMKTPTAHRPALLSEELHDTLNEYPCFRHVIMTWCRRWRVLSSILKPRKTENLMGAGEKQPFC